MNSGDIPVLSVFGETIPHAYERAIKEVWEKGVSVRTEYDHPEDPPSRDATVVITVDKPFGQPRFHRSFEDRTWTSEFVRPHFIDDGVGKGLRPMLAREHDMPPEVREAVSRELEAMEREDYVV